jgi:hypothetical protein
MTRGEPVTDPGPGSGSPALIEGVDVDAVAAAVRSCAAVDDLYSTPAMALASYLPGRQVAGVRVGDGAVTVQVRSTWAVPIAEVAHQVRVAISALTAHHTVHVVVADITDAPGAVVLALPSAATGHRR